MNKFEELVAKLEELFELDKADLDFGIHRIIKQKHVQIKDYLHKTLPEKVKKVLGSLIQNQSQVKLDEMRRKCVETFGIEAFEHGDKLSNIYVNTPLGIKYTEILKQALETVDAQRNEAEVYSHLYEFFSRYYDNADFLSLRRTSSKHKYSVPYNGEEVLLHWANKDQYYIKSSETLNDYTFTLKENNQKLRVKFKLTNMDPVQDNNKAARAFVIDEEKEIQENPDLLVIPFHFKEFSTKPNEKQVIENLETTLQAILPEKWKQSLFKEDLTFTGKDSRTILRKHLVNYTKKNTSDFFIHKNLGEFLRNELDFYIKNEVMYLDDVDDRPVKYLEKVISKIKAIRIVAKDLITFLTQFEDFQKKLWLKKKFVVQTNYCITIDRIAKELYPEIIANNRQREEWVKLFAINEIEAGIGQPGYSSPLSMEFLKANPYLVLDTVFFDEDFKYRVLCAIDDFDEQCDGVLIHSENFQALSLLQERYHKQVKCVYIDPPYNTNASEINYKNGYKNSTWLSFIDNRLVLGKNLLNKSGIQCTTIDDVEFHKLREIISNIFNEGNIAGVVSVKNNPSGRSTVKGISIAHEYAIFSFSSDASRLGMVPRTQKQLSQYGENDDEGKFQWRNFMRSGGSNDFRAARPKLHYPLVIYENTVKLPKMEWNTKTNKWEIIENLTEKDIVAWPGSNGNEYTWRLGVDTLKSCIGDIRVRDSKMGKKLIEIKFRLDEEGVLPKTIWDDKFVNATAYGTTLLRHITGISQSFSFPKSLYAVERSIRVCSSMDNDIILDYFAGSGTTAHAVINLNREDKGKRKYILVEMGDYFNTVLKPRIQKVIYSKDWKDGKPKNRNTGISHCFKYLRLESYEDTLNNLTLEDRQADLSGLKPDVQEQYLINYMLDIETRGSLLNMKYFENPFDCRLKIYNQETGEAEAKNIDLPETFNYLLGLTVNKIRKKHDFLTIEGKNPAQETVLVIWRNVKEKENTALEEFVTKTLEINTANTDYKAIYINGDTTLNDPHKKVMLTEEIFHNLMFDEKSL